MKCTCIVTFTIIMSVLVAHAQAPKDDALTKASLILKQARPLQIADLAVVQLKAIKLAKEDDFLGTWVAENGVAFQRFEEGGTGSSGTLAFGQFEEIINSRFTWRIDGERAVYKFSDGSGGSYTAKEIRLLYPTRK